MKMRHNWHRAISACSPHTRSYTGQNSPRSLLSLSKTQYFYMLSSPTTGGKDIICFPVVHLAVRPLLTLISRYAISLYLVEGFQWNLAQMFVMWVGTQGYGHMCTNVRLLWRRRHTFQRCGVEAYLFKICIVQWIVNTMLFINVRKLAVHLGVTQWNQQSFYIHA